ncbi:MAG: DedA family protein [Oligoflexia bacterium]|nr:DedA family protein [Oligoflexia bacterium]
MGYLKRLYNWVLHWAETPYGLYALFILAFIESSFFPIPPDVLLIALVLGKTSRWFKFALACSVASVLGGMFGYLIGYSFMDAVGYSVIDFYNARETFVKVQNMYREHGVLALGIAGFTPIPYKVFTIASGVFKLDFVLFVIVSFISRGLRFFILSFVISRFGEPIRVFIDRYFNLLTYVFMVLLILGYVAVKYIF